MFFFLDVQVNFCPCFSGAVLVNFRPLLRKFSRLFGVFVDKGRLLPVVKVLVISSYSLITLRLVLLWFCAYVDSRGQFLFFYHESDCLSC